MMDDMQELLFQQSYNKSNEEEAFFQSLNHLLKAADFIPSDPTISPEKLPLIYIVGAPRSGTTLLYQLIARYLPIGYINNLIARFWLRPSVGIRLSQACLLEHQRNEIPLQSVFGRSPNVVGPHEFSYFWNHWLGLEKQSNHHLSSSQLQRVDREGLKNSLENEILAPFGKATVFKYLPAGFHAHFLTSIHPCTLFIYIKRKEVDVISSILNSRKSLFGSYRSWWTIKPSTFPFPNLGKNPVHDIIKQVRDIQMEMEEELNIEGIQTLHITYEELCQSPSNVLTKISLELTKLGVEMSLLDKPAPLNRSKSSVSLPYEMREMLEKLL